MQKAKLSIVIPAYNESRTITKVPDKIREARLPNDTLRVDQIGYLRNEKNSGKGFGIRRAIQTATGNFVIIQDADLEYDPPCFAKLPALEGVAGVVYGSRLMSTSSRRILFFWRILKYSRFSK